MIQALRAAGALLAFGLALLPRLAGSDPVIGGRYVLAAGQTHSGDLIAIGAEVHLEPGSVVEGDVLAVGGSLEIGGEVRGDVASIGGRIHLAGSAWVTGNVGVLGAMPTLDAGATIGGELRGADGVLVPWRHLFNGNPPEPSVPSAPSVWNILYDFTATLFRIVVLSLVAVILAMFLPRHMEQVSQAATARLGSATAIGAGSWLALLMGSGILLLTLCLAPVVLIVGVAAFAAAVFGWASLGRAVGRRAAAAIGRSWHLAVEAGVGTLLLSLAAAIAWLLPCIGPLVVGLAVASAFGAVILARLGAVPSRG